MRYADILMEFYEVFPMFKGMVRNWEPNGRHGITVELKNHQRLIFTYQTETEWTLRSVGMNNKY